MELITILEENIKKRHQRDWYIFLSIEKFLVEENFDWLKLHIDFQSKSLLGKGVLNIGCRTYTILLSYSPFHEHRYDRIYVNDRSISYNKDIHLYRDLSLCLYHPTVDQPIFQKIPLFKMVPWISEWVVFYEQWKKYGIWFGKEIKH